MEPNKNQLCPCESGKLYKRCCMLTGGLTIKKNGKGYKRFNKRLNRYETDIDHHYFTHHYAGCEYLKTKPYKARLKCRLLHEEKNSIIIPDYIFLKNGWIQPLHFTAPMLFRFEDGVECFFFIDIQNGITVKVCFWNDGFIKSYPDGSQLFKCDIYGPKDIEQYACGNYDESDGDITLELFHHTDDIGFNGITGSSSLRSSRWNYRGSKECLNHHFVYFTHIPEIKYANDLITVAMSADGNIDYAIDSFNIPRVVTSDYRTQYADSIYTANVYRATTANRNRPLKFYVPVQFIDVKHVYRHYQENLCFYEICFPYIHRIKVEANSFLPFTNEHFIQDAANIFHSDYCIVGDARYKQGLAAPFEEEDTEYVYKIQDCGEETINEFWFNHGNQDLFSKKTITALKVADVDNNPTK